MTLPAPYYQRDSITIYHGSSLDILPMLGDESIDSVVTDPPYEFGFMGKAWDASGIAYNVDLWREVLRVLKPGGQLLAFGGSRTYHRLAVAVEDAGFEIRDQLQWIYGSGFPKSHDISKAIDKAAGAERGVVEWRKSLGGRTTAANPMDRVSGKTNSHDPITEPATPDAKQWDGWGTALKPAHEPIVLARKPFSGTVAANVLEHGTGGINVDGCRIETGDKLSFGNRKIGTNNEIYGQQIPKGEGVQNDNGRWPANVIHDGSDEVVGLFPDNAGGGKATGYNWNKSSTDPSVPILGNSYIKSGVHFGESGSAARFFYTAKASQSERNHNVNGRNTHPTVKPVDLIRWLCKLITPPGGTILDPFYGSGTTGVAARLLGFKTIGIELDEDYCGIAVQRLSQQMLAL